MLSWPPLPRGMMWSTSRTRNENSLRHPLMDDNKECNDTVSNIARRRPRQHGLLHPRRERTGTDTAASE